MISRNRVLRELFLLCSITMMASAAYGGTPTCSGLWPWQSCWFQMPVYDQTNPNFAAYLTPSTVVSDVGNSISTAPITAFEIRENIITFTAANYFSPGDTVIVTGLSSTVGQTLNWGTYTVLGIGLSGSAFEVLYQHAYVARTSDSGTASATGTPVPNIMGCSPTVVCGNPFDSAWIPAGPIPGDPYSLEGWWYTAICCPTAESMALMGAIAAKSPSTTVSGWTANFYAGLPPAAPSGLTNQTGPIFPFVTDPRQHMQVADIQRVIDMALAQGTNPSAGGAENYITTIGGDFTPAATGANGSTNAISNATFIADIRAGTVVVIAIHYFQASVTPGSGTGNDAVTFTQQAGGHCLAVSGYTTIPILGPPRNFARQSLDILDPVGGVEDFISIVNLTNGTFTQGTQTRTVTLPYGNTSVGVWPDAANPVNSVWDITDGESITFIDEYHTLSVP